jgi:hypothetical protein
MSFYLFIAISFDRNIVCKNIVCELGLCENVLSILKNSFFAKLYVQLKAHVTLAIFAHNIVMKNQF